MDTGINWFLQRASERSTWFGITAFLTGLGLNISADLSNVIISLGVGIGGLIAIITGDK